MQSHRHSLAVCQPPGRPQPEGQALEVNRQDAEALHVARELDRLGHDEDAKRAYLDHLQRHPDDAEVLTDLGNLAFRTRYRRAARTAYARVVQLRPFDPAARVNLGNAWLDAGDLQAAQAEYEAALAVDPAFAPAHQGLSHVFAQLADDATSRHHRDLGFAGNALAHVPYQGEGTALRVLVLTSAAGGNFNTNWLLDPHRFDVVRLALDYVDARMPLPPHDVIVNAIGDADLCQRELETASCLIARSSARVVNAPVRVLNTGRVAHSEQLRAVAGTVVPRMATIPKAAIAAGGEALLRGHGFDFPLLLRTPGHNTGRHFVKVARPTDLRAALETLPGDQVLAIEYFDLAETGGWTRKYRVIAIDQELFPVHAAISADWKVHLFSASHAPEHQEEDARFLDDPRNVLPPGVLAALEAIVRRLGLDYAGVDFGIDAAGHLVLFEANATMSIHPVDPGDPFAYRRAAIGRIFAAFERMIGPPRAGQPKSEPVEVERGE